MIRPRQMVETLLSRAGVAIGGINPWDIAVHDDRFFARVLREKNLGLGEAYMDGWWDCRRIDEFMCRVLKSRLDSGFKGGLKYVPLLLPGILFNLQSKARAHIVARRHYDLGNDLFLAFLDPYNQYSCACFDGTAELDQAQRNKLELICRKIALTRTDHVLDIGCGWGGFAKYAAERCGCTVTAANISREQIRYAAEFCKGLPRLQSKYDARFKRMWDYYLLSCAGAFRARSNQVWQIVLTKYGTAQPRCRF